MPFLPLRPTLAQWGVLAAVSAGLIALLLSTERSHVQAKTLPNAAGSSIEYLDAADAALAIDEVAALPDSRWHPAPKPGFVPTPGPPHRLWVRTRLSNDSSGAIYGILADGERYADQVDFYFRDNPASLHWQHFQVGEKITTHTRDVQGRENAFPVVIPPGEKQTVYLRYEDFFAIWLQQIWWPDQMEFYGMQLHSTLMEGLYFGTLLALLFYNAVIWLRIQLAPMGSYLLYLASFMAFMFFARSMPQLLGWPLGSPWMESLLTGSLSASAVFLLEFGTKLLDLRTWMPRALRWLQALQIAMVVLTVVSYTAPWLRLTSLLTLPGLGCVVVHFAVFGVAIAARQKGAPQSSYVVLAIGTLFAGVCPALPIWVEIITVHDAFRFVMAGSALEMVMLAVIMSDRIGRLQQEKIAAQEALLREAEHRETLQEAYADDLALEVRERTAELEAANADKDRILTVLGHDLRSPLTGLTRSAEYWAAQPIRDDGLRGFMSEAAQTGRNLLLMIEDLVMWARLRAGTGHMAVHPFSSIAVPVLALNRMQAETSKIALEAHLPDALFVWTDLVPVQALMRNLLSNALRAARQKVVVEAAVNGECVEVRIRDDGEGLCPLLAKALAGGEPGQLPNTHGLGLRLCLEINRTLDLKLTASSVPTGGTEFRFCLAAVTS